MSFGTKGCMYCEGECNKECLSQEEPKQREMFLMNATTVIDTRKPKQETVVNEKCFKCGNSQYKIGTPFCTDEFCNKYFYQEPKQETLEEAAEKYWAKQPYNEDAFTEGAKWQAERMYSEEDIKSAFFSGCQSERQIKPRVKCWEEWFEQFKKD